MAGQRIAHRALTPPGTTSHIHNLLPSSLAQGLPAPAVFYGNQLIVADGKEHNGAASYQIVADVLDLEGVAKQNKSGLLFQDRVRHDFDALKATIKSGGK